MFSDQIATSNKQSSVSDDRWPLVLRIAESPQFQKSPRLRDFLFFVCEKCILNCPEDLREYHIGFHVFNKPDYNPAEDNIVRVEARLLRKRLEEYFEKEGRREPVIIRIPKGSYVPVFEQREVAEQDIAPVATQVVLPAEEISPSVEPDAAIEPEIPAAKPSRWRAFAIAGLLAGLCLAVWISFARRETPAAVPLWSQIFGLENDTRIVCADSALVLLQDITHQPVSLADYANRDYMQKTGKLDANIQSVVNLLPGKYYTSIADLQLIDRIHGLNASRWGHASIRSARNISATDLKSGNFILLGSSRANPWVSLFEPQLNFLIEYDEQLRQPLVRNRRPKTGEQAIYRPDKVAWNDQDAFSIIALLPNLTHTGEILIIAGTSMQGTEAAGEFLMDQTRSRNLFRAIGTVRQNKLPYFEALLRSGTLAGTAKDSELIAYRLLPN